MPNLQAGQEEEVRAPTAVLGEDACAVAAQACAVDAGGAAASTDVGAAVLRAGEQRVKYECT